MHISKLSSKISALSIGPRDRFLNFNRPSLKVGTESGTTVYIWFEESFCLLSFSITGRCMVGDLSPKGITFGFGSWSKNSFSLKIDKFPLLLPM